MEKIICFNVVKPQGIKGEVKARILADGFSSIKNVKNVYDANGKLYKVLKIRDAFSGFAFLMLEGISDRNTAELFRGVDFYVEKNKINKKDDEFFISDIIGLKVLVDGEDQGTVLDVIQASVDMFEIVNNGKKWYFPFLKSLEIVFDFNAKTLSVSKEKLDGVKYSED
ncbi:MAG: 16S rRNA processing protein RimM [Clostridiales bacterium]|nr:16S rRNA processing protein RimM [Clostridiales bacterium]